MAPVTPAQLQLIKDYEPVLYFHGGGPGEPAERFFPSDAKRYLERCSLWKVQGEDDFGENPVEAADRLCAIEGEDDIYIGKQSSLGVYDFLRAPLEQGEYFLSFTDWRPAGSPFPAARRYADLDRLAALYASDEEFWYHAEFFDASRLRVQLQESSTGINKIDLTKLLQPEGGAPPILSDPALICYYLFYPGHDEGLTGCGDAPQGREFASFAGEWSCVAILLDRSAPDAEYAAKWIGLSNRNTGLNQFNGNEIRAGMRILSWSKVKLLNQTHTQLAVARGSHGLYLMDEMPVVRPFTPVDPSSGSCGLAEAPAAENPGDTSLSPVAEGNLVFFGKVLAGGVAGSLLGPIGSAVGAFGGAVWGLVEAIEISQEAWPEYYYFPEVSTNDSISTVSGRVIHPAGMLPPDVSAERGRAWKSKDNVMIGERRYDSTVDRDAQIIWPRDLPADDYTLRWGPRVVSDPQRRRAGMMFPNFWLMFFDTLVRADPPRKPVVLSVGQTSWTVPVDWNSADNTIECIGGGGGGVIADVVRGGSGGAGGGGAYSKIANAKLAPGTPINFQVGKGGPKGSAGNPGGAGGDTFFGGSSLVECFVGAQGGKGANSFSGATGGNADSGTGTLKFSGGAGADGGRFGAPGGGGAGGPKGAGGNGAQPAPREPGGAGGGGNGLGASGETGAAQAAGKGGNNASGSGGGAAGLPNQDGGAGLQGGGGGGGGGHVTSRGGAGGPGGAGNEFNATQGSGGGGGGGGGSLTGPSVGGNGGNGGLYGGGGGGGGWVPVADALGQGGDGADGVIFISYVPSPG